MRARSKKAGLVVGALCVAQACAFSHIDLIQDSRVRITAPADRQKVELPVLLSWTSKGAARFAVFVDRAAIKPGASLRSVARGDDPCLRRPGCPDDKYLRERGVYVVAGNRLTLPALADKRTRHQAHDRHQVIVVVLAGDRRDGEGAFLRSFEVNRGSLP